MGCTSDHVHLRSWARATTAPTLDQLHGCPDTACWHWHSTCAGQAGGVAAAQAVGDVGVAGGAVTMAAALVMRAATRVRARGSGGRVRFRFHAIITVFFVDPLVVAPSRSAIVAAHVKRKLLLAHLDGGRWKSVVERNRSADEQREEHAWRNHEDAHEEHAATRRNARRAEAPSFVALLSACFRIGFPKHTSPSPAACAACFIYKNTIQIT